MTAKELLLVLAVAGVAGAGAGIGAIVVAQPAPPPDATAALDDKLSRIETALGKISGDQETARRSIADLGDKVSGLQIDVSSVREETRAAARETATADDGPKEPFGRTGRARRPVEWDLPNVTSADGAKPVRLRIARGAAGEEMVAGEILGADGERLAGELGKRLQGVANGVRLRMMPEAKRWEQARTDMGLNDFQVDELKRATADRDEALKGAMQVETSGEGGDEQVTIKRMDPAKAATAQKDYDEKVSRTLDQDQRKKWDEKGYGHAFGGTSGGHSIAIVQSMEFDAHDAGDGK